MLESKSWKFPLYVAHVLMKGSKNDVVSELIVRGICMHGDTSISNVSSILGAHPYIFIFGKSEINTFSLRWNK